MAKKQIIYAFIDSQNLNLGIKSLGWDLDFKRFYVYLKEKYLVSKTYLFIGYLPENKKLYQFLKHVGYSLIFKPTTKYKRHGKITTKGNVDAELVLQTMIEWHNFDQAILVSGDGDFYCLIKHLAKNHKLAKVITPNRKYSSLIKEFAKYINPVEGFKNKVERK